MSRHAFLIIAHDNFSVLDRLLSVLEHPDVDIYLHIDAKVRSLPAIKYDNPRLHMIKNRIDTRWGDISQIETEYALLEAALKDGGYAYYHILSGVHFPLMPVGQILEFFEERRGQTIFHGLCTASKYQETRKLRYFNILTRHFATGPFYFRWICQTVNRAGLYIQSILKVDRHKDLAFYKASNWASFTEEATLYLLEKKPFAMRIFKHSFCGDEFFAPTLLMDSRLKDKINNYDKYLKLEMGEASPRVFLDTDFNALVNSGYMFARKFNDDNIGVVEKILQSFSE